MPKERQAGWWASVRRQVKWLRRDWRRGVLGTRADEPWRSVAKDPAARHSAPQLLNLDLLRRRFPPKRERSHVPL